MKTYSVNNRLKLFPLTTKISSEESGDYLILAECKLKELAENWGTPLYIIDQATLNIAVESYRSAMIRHFPGTFGITYAGKAFLNLALAQWAGRQGLWLDCTGHGEIHIAREAGVPPENILVHGVNKSSLDLICAIELAGTIVVDNLPELERLLTLTKQLSTPVPHIWLRFRTGVAVETHTYTQTGQEDSKFGMSEEEIVKAASLCTDNQLPLIGLHFHQGSHFHNLAPIAPGIDAALKVSERTKRLVGWTPDILCPGGGWAVPYSEEDLPHPSIEEYVRYICEQVAIGCKHYGLPLPRLQLEPGRSLVASAGVAVYQVGTVKDTASRRWYLIDGGMADNIRPALYQARYSALPVERLERIGLRNAWIAGPYCESGDIMIGNILLPDLEPGEYIAIPASGAYHLSMSSNYNGARKPAVLWLANGTAHLVQKRETIEDLTRRDLPLPEGVI